MKDTAGIDNVVNSIYLDNWLHGIFDSGRAVILKMRPHIIVANKKYTHSSVCK